MAAPRFEHVNITVNDPDRAAVEALLGDAPHNDAWLRLSLAKHDGDTPRFAKDAAFKAMRNDPAVRLVAAQLRAQ
jgi:hypothetical protein